MLFELSIFINIYHLFIGMKDVKIKGLRPTLRVKKRFLLIKVHSEKKNNFKDLSYSINQHLLKVLGAYSYGKFGIWILRERYDEKNNTIVIKVIPQGVDLLLATLELGTEIEKSKVRFEVLNISGTLKQLYAKSKK